jgi:signal transduction histidine kinase/PAS domain-containing protein
MQDEDRKKDQPKNELMDFHQLVAKLGASRNKLKSAEEALRDSEAQKQSILDVSVDMVMQLDMEMRILWVNKVAVKLLQDITDQKRIQKEIETLNQQMEFILGATKTGLDIIDSEFTIRYIDPEWKKTYGDSTGKRCYEYFLYGDKVCPGCGIKKAMETKEVTVIEKVLVKEGNRPIQVTTIPFQNDEGEWLFAQVSIDISKRNQADMRIKHHNLVLQAIRKVNELIAREKDQNRLIEGICEALIKTGGYQSAWIALLDKSKGLVATSDAGLGENFTSMIEGLKPGKWCEYVENGFSQSDIVIIEDPEITCGKCPLVENYSGKGLMIVKLEYGDKGYGLLNVSLPRDYATDKEEQDLFKEVAGDIALALQRADLEEQRKRAETEREHLNVELMNKNKELEQIVYVASHDLRSPLVNIQGFSNELKRSLEEMDSTMQSIGVFKTDVSLGDKRRLISILKTDIPEFLQYIFKSISKMDSLLSGLLKLSRLGRAALNIEQVDMSKLISNVVGSFEFRIKETDITVKIDELPSCRGDEVQINQVFSNLLDNALKFIDNSSAGVIRISGRKKNGQAIFCVEDNGIGISEEFQDVIFEIFYKLDGDASTGEGLGLTIVRKILDRQSGKIWLESEPGKGSQFFVSLPG